MQLCPWCASKLDVQPLAEGDQVSSCVNQQYHAENPEKDPKSVAALHHDKLFGETGPLPLCETCSSPFAIKMNPLSEDALKFEWMIPMLQKEKKAMLETLIRVANSLDAKGLYEEAGVVDSIIHEVK
jgi:hypothetical protein